MADFHLSLVWWGASHDIILGAEGSRATRAQAQNFQNDVPQKGRVLQCSAVNLRIRSSLFPTCAAMADRPILHLPNLLLQDAIRDDFGHLPPEQRKNAIHKKVEELSVEHGKVSKVRSCGREWLLFCQCRKRNNRLFFLLSDSSLPCSRLRRPTKPSSCTAKSRNSVTKRPSPKPKRSS